MEKAWILESDKPRLNNHCSIHLPEAFSVSPSPPYSCLASNFAVIGAHGLRASLALRQVTQLSLVPLVCKARRMTPRIRKLQCGNICPATSAWPMIGACTRAQSLQSCLTLGDPMNCGLPGSFVHGDSPSKNTGVGCHSLLQEIFPVQGSNPCFPCLLHWRWILYCWATREALVNCYFPSFSLAQFFLYGDSCPVFTLVLQTTKPLLRAAASVYLQPWVELHSCTGSCFWYISIWKSTHPPSDPIVNSSYSPPNQITLPVSLFSINNTTMWGAIEGNGAVCE